MSNDKGVVAGSKSKTREWRLLKTRFGRVGWRAGCSSSEMVGQVNKDKLKLKGSMQYTIEETKLHPIRPASCLFPKYKL